MPEVFERKRFEITQEESKKIEYAMEKINALKNLILVADVVECIPENETIKHIS